MLVAHWYQFREAAAETVPKEIEFACGSLLEPYATSVLTGL